VELWATRQWTARLAKARLGDWKPDERDLEEARELGHGEFKHVLFALPEDRLFSRLERAGMALDDRQKQEFRAYARRELRNDPIALEQPIAEDGQMVPLRAGTNLENCAADMQHNRSIPVHELALCVGADHRGT